MGFVGRTRELGQLRAALDRRDASIIRVTGVRGGGKSALVLRAIGDYPHLVYRAPPLTDRSHRTGLMEGVSSARADRGRAPHLEATAPEWGDLLSGVLDVEPAGGRPFVLVLDDVHRLSDARSRYVDAVSGLIRRARDEGRPIHVVLIGPEAALPGSDQVGEDEPPPVEVGPLPFRAAATLLPGSRPHDLLRAYGLFGGIPRVLASLDHGAALGTNLRRLLFSPDGALTDAGGTWLERDVQTPARYYAVLRALAPGEADWSTLHAGVPEMTRSGQVAPYITRLEELGLVRSRRSLDAGPGSRAKRYVLADPFLATWLRFVLAAPVGAEARDWSDYYSTHVRPALDDHLESVFPIVCRQHMEHDAIGTIGENARESGSLWGPEYDLPVAGILTLGSAFYGVCHWSQPRRDPGPLESLDRQIRETRYGFGRQGRLRIVFSGHEAPSWVHRQIARRHDATLVDAAGLAGA